MKFKEIQREKGITLIALVITIIVLLILAGVSIAMLTGQNGILTQAQKSKSTAELKSAEEKVKLAIMTARSQSETGELDADKLIAEITNNYEGTATKTNNEFPINATVDGKNFSIDRNGNVKDDGTSNTKPENKIETGTVILLTSTKNTTEEFYIMSYDENTKKAKALAKYNLKIGANYDSNDNKIADIDTTKPDYGLQDSTMKGWVQDQQRNGTLVFSDSIYWYNDNTYKSQGNSSFPWIYDNKSNLYKYVELYKTLLGNTDKVSEVSLASYEDIDTLWSNNSKYTWLYSTSYWLGSTKGPQPWSVVTDCSRGTFYNNLSANFGIRPVITIDMSKL